MREFEYQLCDVFTSRRLEGNQLAVFLDAAALTADEMQAIAREMNLSETTFVHRRDKNIERARGVRVRIFTTQEELPFAGHPTLGTAATIRQTLPDYAECRKDCARFECGAGCGDVSSGSQCGGRCHVRRDDAA